MSGPSPSPDTPQGSDPASAAQRAAEQIAAQAQQQNQIRSLAEVLVPQSDPGVILVKGTVVSWAVGFPPTVTIQLGGDTSASIPAVRYLDSYTPTPGDTVLVAKQGNEIIVVGKAHELYSGQPAKSGWQPVSPTTTWAGSNNSLTPPLYRRVFDHGDQKIQLQGRLWRNGSNTGTTMFTLPSGYRPGIQRVVVAGRENLSGGANALQLTIGTDGTVAVSGHQLEVAGVSSSGSGTTGLTNTDHKHRAADIGTESDFVRATWWTDVVVWSFTGTQGVGHSHTTPNHTHTMTYASFPGWVSLDGLEFFL